MGKDNAAFRKEFQRILNEAGHGLADFTGFFFPSANYDHHRFEPQCVFNGAVFPVGADFVATTFAQIADFDGASFQRATNFTGATFLGGGSFVTTSFHQTVSFSGANFVNGADFTWAEFEGPALFRKSRFDQNAYFFEATFAQSADFSNATFAHGANFYGVTFKKEIKFNSGGLDGLVDFTRAKFLGVAEFWETGFRRADSRAPGPVFSLADFSRPEAVIFYKTYLGQALFHNCNVSKLAFISVEWPRRKRSGKRMVFEEEIDLSEVAASALRPTKGSANERDYELIEGLYQQLKKNYDEAKDYWTAGDFHFGEMEMKRLSSRRRNVAIRYLHQHLRLAAWYRYASNYGESFGLPALWLFVILLVFGAAFPLVGLRYDIGKQFTTSVAQTTLPQPSAMAPPSTGSPKNDSAQVGKEKPDGIIPSILKSASEVPSGIAESKSHPNGETRKGPILAHDADSSAQSTEVGPSIPTPSPPGLQEITSGQTSSVVLLTFWEPFLPGEGHEKLWMARRRLFGNGLITALDIAAFQREPVYQPVYPLGRLLALLEMVLTSTLFALFLLAVHRQFRR